MQAYSARITRSRRVQKRGKGCDPEWRDPRNGTCNVNDDDSRGRKRDAGSSEVAEIWVSIQKIQKFDWFFHPIKTWKCFANTLSEYAIHRLIEGYPMRKAINLSKIKNLELRYFF
jgi:hypothetical protein